MNSGLVDLTTVHILLFNGGARFHCLPQVLACVSHMAHVPLNVCTVLHRPSAYIRASSKFFGLVSFWGCYSALGYLQQVEPKDNGCCGA